MRNETMLLIAGFALILGFALGAIVDDAVVRRSCDKLGGVIFDGKPYACQPAKEQGK